MRTDCEDCGRPLINPKYQRLGRGRVCYIKKFGAPPPSTRAASVRAPRPARAAEPVLTGFPDVDRETDELSRAAEAVVDANLASAVLIQRRLHVGFGKAARLLDQLEDFGVVGPQPGDGQPRPVLVSPAGLDAVLQRIREAK